MVHVQAVGQKAVKHGQVPGLQGLTAAAAHALGVVPLPEIEGKLHHRALGRRISLPVSGQIVPHEGAVLVAVPDGLVKAHPVSAHQIQVQKLAPGRRKRCVVVQVRGLPGRIALHRGVRRERPVRQLFPDLRVQPQHKIAEEPLLHGQKRFQCAGGQQIVLIHQHRIRAFRGGKARVACAAHAAVRLVDDPKAAVLRRPLVADFAGIVRAAVVHQQRLPVRHGLRLQACKAPGQILCHIVNRDYYAHLCHKVPRFPGGAALILCCPVRFSPAAG